MDGRKSRMTDWTVYIIRCANNSLYTGITTDVARRLQQHETGNRGARYLKGKGPLSLVWQHPAENRSEASQLEYKIKQLCKDDKERLVRGDMHVTGIN